MHRGSQFLTSLFLATALVAPVALMAATPQDDRNHEERRENHKRYYDKHHKDYHTWDDNEDRYYQRYQTERHERRAFIELNTRQRTVYWTWRHNNPDVR